MGEMIVLSENGNENRAEALARKGVGVTWTCTLSIPEQTQSQETVCRAWLAAP